MRISISPTDPFPYLAEHLPPCKSRINISTHAVLERLPRADLPAHPHSLYNPYFPLLGVVDEPPRAPSMRTYSYFLDPTEVPTPPLNHSLPHYAGVALEPAHARAELAYHTHSVPMTPSTEVLPPQAHAHRTHVLGLRSTARAARACAGACSSHRRKDSMPIQIRDNSINPSIMSEIALSYLPACLAPPTLLSYILLLSINPYTCSIPFCILAQCIVSYGSEAEAP